LCCVECPTALGRIALHHLGMRMAVLTAITCTVNHEVRTGMGNEFGAGGTAAAVVGRNHQRERFRQMPLIDELFFNASFDVSRQQYAVPRVLDHQHTGAVIGIVGNLPEGGTSRQEMKLDLLPLPGSIGVTVMHWRPQQGLGLTRLTSNNSPDPQVFNKALHASGMIFVVMAYHQL